MPSLQKLAPDRGLSESTAATNALTEEMVVDVRIDGNRTVATHKIMGQIHTRAGRAYNVQSVQDDVRALTRMGLFVDVRPSVDRVQPGRVVVVFRVTEKPLLQDVIIVGNDTYKTGDGSRGSRGQEVRRR